MGDLLILLLPLVLLLFIVNRGRRQQRQLADLQSSLAPGQEVMTTAGLHARVVELRDTSVVLEIAPGVETTWARAAVARRLDTDAPVLDEDATADGTADDSVDRYADRDAHRDADRTLDGSADGSAAPGASPLRDLDGPGRSDRPER